MLSLPGTTRAELFRAQQRTPPGGRAAGPLPETRETLRAPPKTTGGEQTAEVQRKAGDRPGLWQSMRGMGVSYGGSSLPPRRCRRRRGSHTRVFASSPALSFGSGIEQNGPNGQNTGQALGL